MAQPPAPGATTMKEVTGTNELGWEVPFPAGSSFVEPGVTPAVDMTFTFDTGSQNGTGPTSLTEHWAGETEFFGQIDILQPVSRFGA